MLLALLLFLFPADALAQRSRIEAAETIAYEIAFPNAAHHEAEVTVTFRNLPARPLELRMSRSSPGRYALHEFAKNVYSVRAVDSRGRQLPIERPNPHQWDVTGHDGTVRVTYTLYADRADGTYSAVDRTHAHLNMPATFMWARGLSMRPVRVTFRAPDPSWRIATQLAPTRDSTTFTASGMQNFLDSPTELSAHDLRTWTVQSAAGPQTIRLAIHHQGTREETDAYVANIQRVIPEAVAVFGGLPRFDHGTYTFIADYLPWVAGDGMEHRNSTILTSTRPLSAGALQNLGTVSHEFVHVWNVERLRPRSLEPFDFESANMSGELWLGEGFTTYYTWLLIRRAGITTNDDYAGTLTGIVNTVVTWPGRGYFSPVEMSQQAPFVDAAVSIDPQNKANTFISYYTWGAGVGLALDLALRQRNPSRTLDDLMQALWRDFGAAERPYTMADVRNTLGSVAGDTTFANDFFRRYITGRGAADYTALLGAAGFLVRPAAPGAAWVGDVPVRADSGGLSIMGNTLVGAPFYAAGLDRGDLIVSLDGKPVRSAEELQTVLAARRPGDAMPIVFDSRGSRIQATINLTESPRLEVVTYETAERPVTDDMRRLREQWLGARAEQ